MKITVTYRGQLRQAAGINSETVEIKKPCTVAEFARWLAQERGGSLQSFLLTHEGSLRSHILFIVGNEQVFPDNSSQLKERDMVTILPPMAGG